MILASAQATGNGATLPPKIVLIRSAFCAIPTQNRQRIERIAPSRTVAASRRNPLPPPPLPWSDSRAIADFCIATVTQLAS
jgi:hypothetical protein